MDKLRTRVGDVTARLAQLATTARVAWAGAPAARANAERGQGLAEYALILALIAIVAITALAFFGLQLSGLLTDPIGSEFKNVVDNLP